MDKKSFFELPPTLPIIVACGTNKTRNTILPFHPEKEEEQTESKGIVKRESERESA